jgi:hypothetical protein
MLRTPRPVRLVASVCLLACACSSQAAAPDSRANGGPTQPVADPVAAASAGSSGFESPDIATNDLAPPLTASTPTTPAVSTGTGTATSKVCEAVQLIANPQFPDMMIVLDRSGSMQDGKRWDPSVAAVRKITSELQAQIRFGLALFPDDGPPTTTVMTNNTNGGFGITIVNASVCAPGKIVVPIAAMNAAPISTELDMTRPGGGTPTSETLMKLLDSYAAEAGPDVEQHPKYVLLVTDGAPTCPNGNGQEPADQADIDLSNKAVEALTSHMVKTYVIGYDTTTPGNEMLAQVLDGLAQRGGTGDQKHRPVEDEASLTAALESITGSIASCSFRLDQAPPRADYVLVTIDGKQLNLDAPDGWKLDDAHTVEIVGNACAMFKAGKHVLDAKVQCDVVQPS